MTERQMVLYGGYSEQPEQEARSLLRKLSPQSQAARRAMVVMDWCDIVGLMADEDYKLFTYSCPYEELYDVPEHTQAFMRTFYKGKNPYVYFITVSFTDPEVEQVFREAFDPLF